MRRLLAWVVFGIFLAAGALWPARQVLAQQPSEAPAETAAKFEPGRLGAELRNLTEQSVKLLGLTQPQALLVGLAVSGGPAERAGLRPGDVLLQLEGAAVGTIEEFVAAIQRLGAGETITLGLVRGNERLTAQATLARSADILQHATGETTERRIAAHEAVLLIFNRETFVHEWATTQSLLGTAYRARIRGDRADNLEKAIAHIEEALTVFTREALPNEWATNQNELGIGYEDRIRGNRADNLEKAIAAYEAALTVRTREATPREWAQTQNNLASAYQARIRGDRADNLEKAIAAYEAALTVRTREAMPREWAETQNNLGNAYRNRIRGERADNLEKAIGHFEAALTLLTREALPYEWALTQNNLAVAYEIRIRGDRASNLEKAIGAYEATLTVRTREALPREWADTQHNLAVAYRNRIRGDRADNLEKAIGAYEAALTVTTREALPREWAGTQNNLAIAYQNRVRGDRVDNLEKTIAHLEAALTVRTREAMPREWAETQSNLAVAYEIRIRGDRASNLEKAIGTHVAALTVLTLEALPRDHLIVGRHLGGALLEAGMWREAGLAYASVRDAFLVLFGQGLNDADARDLIGLAGPLFTEAAFAAAQRGEAEAALVLASEGRARLMAVALKLQALDLSADKRRRLDDLRAAIRTTDRTVEATQGTERAAAVEKLSRLRQELLGLVKGADTAASTSTSALAQARALVAKGGAVAVPIVTKVGGKILIVAGGVRPSGSDTMAQPKNVGPKASKTDVGAKVSYPPLLPASGRTGLTPSLTLLDLPELTTDRLDRLMRGDVKDGKTGGWLGAYNINYLPSAEQERRWGEWQDAIAGLGPELWHLIGARLDVALKEAGVKSGARLVWLPSGALGILPLGLAQDPASKRRLADTYEIVYAPSLDALASAQTQIAKAAPATLAAIINPTKDLAGTEKEGKLVASHFPGKNRTVLERNAATPDAVLAALKGKTHWHFASHGTFSWTDARQSALLMHGQAPLSVGRLLETDGLGRPRLVVLSACETGLYDIDRNPDEFIGLPGTFMALGAAGVLGTLWPVSDAATALLIAKFYELHMGERLAPPTALRRAQLWLRQATNAQLEGYVRVAAKQARLEVRQVAEIVEELSEEGLARSRNAAAIEWITPDEIRAAGKKTPTSERRLARPYAHPYFWAGFIYTGL